MGQIPRQRLLCNNPNSKLKRQTKESTWPEYLASQSSRAASYRHR